MLAVQLKLLLPSLLLHLVVTVAAAVAAWYAVARFKPEWRISWALPVALGATYSLYLSASALISLHQNELLVRLAASQRSGAEAAAVGQNGGNVDPKLQLKQDFLRAVDELSGTPDRITADSTRALFEKFAALFPSGGTERADYAKGVLDVYTCQQLLYEDALASFKFKKGVKSEDRERCEKADGRFFNREKLVPAEVAKQNSQLIESVAARKPLDGPGGKPVELTEAMIRNSLEGQMRKSEAIRMIFSPLPDARGKK